TALAADDSSARRAETDRLATEIHRYKTDPRIGQWLEDAEAEIDGSDAYNAWDAVNLRLMREFHAEDAAIPPEAHGAREEAASNGQAVWKTARDAADFTRALPAFEQVVFHTRACARLAGAALGMTPQDALFHTY